MAERTIAELITHIAARVAATKPVTLSAASARTVLNALMELAASRRRTWEEDLHFELGVWDEKDRLVEVIARLGNLIVARAAFRAAVIARPDNRILLKQKAWVLADSRQLPGRDWQSAETVLYPAAGRRPSSPC